MTRPSRSNTALFARCAVLDDNGIIAVAGEEDDAAAAVAGHVGYQRIDGIEDGGAVGKDDIHRGALDPGDLFEGVMSLRPRWSPLPMLVTTATSTAVEAEPLAEDAAAGGFEDGGARRRDVAAR